MTPPTPDRAAHSTAMAASGPTALGTPVALPTRLGPSAVALRTAAFLLLVGLSVAWTWQPLSRVILLSLRYSTCNYSHIVLIPLISIALVVLQRGAVFARVAYAPEVESR